MIKLSKNDSGKYEITESEYERVVSVCKVIYKNTNNAFLYDSKKKKFSNSDIFPTIKELESHDVREKFELYFPYLVYYLEVYECAEPEFRKTTEYIADLFFDMLEMKMDSRNRRCR